jgi:hypothetical protein
MLVLVILSGNSDLDRNLKLSLHMLKPIRSKIMTGSRCSLIKKGLSGKEYVLQLII